MLRMIMLRRRMERMIINIAEEEVEEEDVAENEVEDDDVEDDDVKGRTRMMLRMMMWRRRKMMILRRRRRTDHKTPECVHSVWETLLQGLLGGKWI